MTPSPILTSKAPVIPMTVELAPATTLVITLVSPTSISVSLATRSPVCPAAVSSTAEMVSVLAVMISFVPVIVTETVAVDCSPFSSSIV